MQQDSWVKYVERCEKCGSGKGPYGGVYANGKRMAVCEACYMRLSEDHLAYRDQVERYIRKGI